MMKLLQGSHGRGKNHGNLKTDFNAWNSAIDSGNDFIEFFLPELVFLSKFCPNLMFCEEGHGILYL